MLDFGHREAGKFDGMNATRWLMRFWVMCLGVILTGCSGFADAIEFSDAASEARDRAARVNAMANTSIISMPDSGSVLYTGHATLAYATGGADFRLLGQARVTADFQTGVVDGRADGFFGGSNGADVQSYAGALTFDGRIGVRRANSFDAMVTGELSGSGQVLTVNGPLLGSFRGAGAAAISAATNPLLEATLNGAPIAAGVRLTAEQ